MNTIEQKAREWASVLPSSFKYDFEERLGILRDGAPLEEWMIAVAREQVNKQIAEARQRKPV